MEDSLRRIESEAETQERAADVRICECRFDECAQIETLCKLRPRNLVGI